MLLQLLPPGLWDGDSVREVWISLLKVYGICFNVEKVLVGFQSGVGRAVPGGAMLYRMKKLDFKIVWVEHPPSYSAPRKQATSPEYTCDVQHGAKWGITWQWSWILKLKGEQKGWNIGDDVPSADWQESKHTAPQSSLHTVQPPFRREKKTPPWLFSSLQYIKKMHHGIYRHRSQGTPGAELRSPFQGKTSFQWKLLIACAAQWEGEANAWESAAMRHQWI